MWLFVQSLVNGLLSGGVYAMVAIGITIVFGVMKIVNFAMGSYLMLGMYLTWVGFQIFGGSNYAMIPFVLVCMAMVAFVSYKLLLGPAMKRGGQVPLLVTIGLSFVIPNLAQIIFGSYPLTVPSDLSNSSIAVGSFTFNLPRVIAFASALVIVFLVNLLLTKTQLGRMMRATAEKPEVAQMLGIHAQNTYTLSFIIGICMAGLSGLLLTPVYFVSTAVAGTFRTTGIMAVVLGGLGSIKGALLGGLMIGLVEALVSTYVAADVGPVGIFVLFLIILYFKPQGLFGEGERIA